MSQKLKYIVRPSVLAAHCQEMAMFRGHLWVWLGSNLDSKQARRAPFVLTTFLGSSRPGAGVSEICDIATRKVLIHPYTGISNTSTTPSLYRAMSPRTLLRSLLSIASPESLGPIPLKVTSLQPITSQLLRISLVLDSNAHSTKSSFHPSID